MSNPPTETIVRRLLHDQFPQWRTLPVRSVASVGTVNAIFRIGDDLVARFRLHGDDPDSLRAALVHEAAALQELAGLSPVPTPEPVAIGESGHGYALPWSIQTWVPGTTGDVDDPGGSVAFARDLAGFISALRTADTRGRTFRGDYRGGHLRDHDAWMDICFSNSEGLLDVPSLRTMWAEMRELPEIDDDVMCHGDLIPPNVLIREGRLAGVLDGGQLAAADPALDLVAAWHLLDDVARQELRDSLGCSDVQWARGRAWAFQQSMGLVWYYAETNPSMSRWGRRTLQRLTAADPAARPR